MNNEKQAAFWKDYLSSIHDAKNQINKTYEAWHFCDNEKDADELGDLARNGIKTATCGMLWDYEVENEALPKVGDLSMVTNWAGDPLCIIESIEVKITAYNEVDEKFAHDEGEGDRTLAYWRKVHWEAFSRSSAMTNLQPTESMPLVCERFRVVFLNKPEIILRKSQ